MKHIRLKKLTSALLVLSLMLSIGPVPAAAEENHTCTEFTQQVTKEATCGTDGVTQNICKSCGKVTESSIPATGQHSYENGVCSVCAQNKPCTLAPDCDSPLHVEECLSQASCTCLRLCSETMCCPVCEGGGQCLGGDVADKIAAVQTRIDALPTRYSAEEREAAFQQYQVCTEAIAELTDAQRGELDLTRYYEAAQPMVIPSQVNSQTDLEAAIAGGAESIVLADSFTVSSPISIGHAFTLDLNGKTITSALSSGHLFQVSSNLVIQGTGSVLSGESGTFQVTAGTVSITGGNFANFQADVSGGFLEISGGTFKTGDTITDVTAYALPGHQQNAEGTVSRQSSLSSAGSPVVSTVSGSQEAVAAIVGNTAVTEVNTGLNQLYSPQNLGAAASLLKTQHPTVNFNGSILSTTVSITLTAVETGPVHPYTLRYEVFPAVKASWSDPGKQDVLAPITDLGGKTVTFRLPVVGTTAGQWVAVAHNGQPLGNFQVQTGNYIQISTTSFSPWTVTVLAEGTKNVAKVDSSYYSDMETAITRLNTDGGTLTLLEEVTTASQIIIPTGKTAVIDLGTKKYTYTGTSSAFVASGNSLELKNGTVAANSGTLIRNTAGSTTVADISYTSEAATGKAISVEAGTITIQSGTFNGNARSVSATGGRAYIHGGNFHQALEGDVTIPGMVNNAINSAQFKDQPAAAMIQQNYSAVSNNDSDNPMYVIRENAHVLKTVGSATSKIYYSSTMEALDAVLKEQGPGHYTLTRDEVIDESHTLTGDTTIVYDSHKITGTGSLTPVGKLFLKGIGNLVSLELGAGDKAQFGANGSVTVTAAENQHSGNGVGYGDVKLTLISSDGKQLTSYYFLGTNARLTIGANGSIATSGQVINQTTTPPTIRITEVSDGSSLTNLFVSGSAKKLVFTTNAFANTLTDVSVGNAKLTEKDYSLNEDETVITLNNAYLKTLTKQKHTLTLQFKDGSTAQANFYVVTSTKPAWTPQTGDTIMTAVALMAVAAAGLGVLLYLGKKKKK